MRLASPRFCRLLRSAFPLSVLCFAASAIATAAQVTAPAESSPLSLTIGTGVVMDCPEGIARIAVSTPEIVDAVTASNTEVMFHARGLGRATIVIWSKSGQRKTYDLTVEPNLDPVRHLLRETFPDQQIDIVASQGSLALVGEASSQAVVDRALALVGASAKGAVSNVKVAPGGRDNQILLRVRFAEMDRSTAFQFGVNLMSTGATNTIGSLSTGQFPAGGFTNVTNGASMTLSDMLNIFAFRPDLKLAAVIEDLQQRGLVQMLAEPNLVATNGKEASFLAGGEVPVPVSQAAANSGAISVQYREYGIRLSFTPWVTPQHTIRIHVKPEVSSLDHANGVTSAGFNIPALITRKVETDVELAEGQSFVIAGLLNEQISENLSQIPGLAHIPILGQLFKSRSESKTKTELIVIVTPSIAAPVANQPELDWPKPFIGAPKDAPLVKP